jgi:hypothetical protein
VLQLSRVVAIALISSLALAGCRSGATTFPESPTPEISVAEAPARTLQTQTVLDQLINAARAGDRAAFTSMVSTRDSAFGPRAQMIFENLRVLPLSTLQLTVRPRFANLPGSRHRELGDASWVQEAVLRWQLSSEAAPAQHTVWLTMIVEGHDTRLAGTTDMPGSGNQPAPLPLWWLEAVRVERTPKATALVSKAINAPNRWARSADAVATKIRPSVAGVVRGWSGRLVVEVPGSSESFEQVLGAPGRSVDQIAAVTRAVGPDPGTAPVHIVVNPVASGKLTPVGVSVLLAHEATHVATHSVDSPAPAWAVEGLADQVAYSAYPDARPAAAAPLVAQVRAGRVPRDLPEDGRFRASEDGVGLAYTEAWLACRYVAERYSPRQLAQLYRQLDRGSTLDQAARSVLNVSAEKFVADWRRYLSSLSS